MQHNHSQSHQAQQKLASTTPKTPEEWKAQEQYWRTEPEISIQRQAELTKHRAIQPNEEKGIYCFGEVRLNRADVEWLLATHESGRGPVMWNDKSQRERVGLDLRGADFSSTKEDQHVNLRNLPLSRLTGSSRFILDDDPWAQARIHLEGADLRYAHLEGTHLSTTHLEGANLHFANLERANLYATHLEGVNLRYAYLEGADLRYAHLEGADLEAIFLADTNHIGPQIANVQWGNTNLATVDWSQVTLLGDEYQARQRRDEQGQKKDKYTQLEEYTDAARANRQIAFALQSQGISEDASRFAYRAQVSQKAVFWFQMIQDGISLRTRISYLGSWLLSWLIFLIAGYGYKFGRSLLTYLVVICGFATAYYLLGIHDIGPHNIPGPHHLREESSRELLACMECKNFSCGSYHCRREFRGFYNSRVLSPA